MNTAKEMAFRILDKMLSARFLMALLVTSVGCLITYNLLKNFSQENEKLIMFVTGQFFVIWVSIVKDYFQRQDRKTEEVKPE
jgi:hypothetical protein